MAESIAKYPAGCGAATVCEANHENEGEDKSNEIDCASTCAFGCASVGSGSDRAELRTVFA
jgi:hypothetical protein